MVSEAEKEEPEEKKAEGARRDGKAGEGGRGSEEEKEDEAKEEEEEEAKETEEERRGGGGKERGQEEAEREANPESEKGKRREPGERAEATVATAEGATLTTRRWSVPRETLIVREPPQIRNPRPSYIRHRHSMGGGEIHLSHRQHHTRGFSTWRLKRRNRS